MLLSQNLDHLVFGVTDLNRAVKEFTWHTGIVPDFGGRHLSRGTMNYLVSLTDDTDSHHAYLEILGPDPDSTVRPVQGFGLDAMESDSMLTWALKATDLETLVETARGFNIDLGTVEPLSRKNSAGDLLTWELTRNDAMPHAGLQPFFIDWLDTAHPAVTTQATLEVVRFDVTLPADTPLSQLLDHVQYTGQVGSEDGANLALEVRGPSGRLLLDRMGMRPLS